MAEAIAERPVARLTLGRVIYGASKQAVSWYFLPLLVGTRFLRQAYHQWLRIRWADARRSHVAVIESLGQQLQKERQRFEEYFEQKAVSLECSVKELHQKRSEEIQQLAAVQAQIVTQRQALERMKSEVATTQRELVQLHEWVQEHHRLIELMSQRNVAVYSYDAESVIYHCNSERVSPLSVPAPLPVQIHSTSNRRENQRDEWDIVAWEVVSHATTEWVKPVNRRILESLRDYIAKGPIVALLKRRR